MTQKQAMPKVQELSPAEDGENSDSDYKDDDPVTAPAPILPKDEVQVAFDEIINNARNLKLNLGDRGIRNEFMESYGNLLVRKTQGYDQTLLHIIANTLGHKSLTRCVVKKDKKLLEHKDESGKTSLHMAIVKKNFRFLSVVLDEIEDLDGLLRMTCEHSRNCIHTAIYHGLGQEYTVKLIKRASEATLCATDQDGLTPLHLAVDYERSSESHLSIVQALIAHGDRAFDEFTTNPKDLSVYEYHQYTRSQAVMRLANSVAPRGTEKSQEEPPGGMQGQKNNPAKGRGGPDGSSEHGNDKGTGVPQEPSRVERVQDKVPAVPSISNDRRGSAFTSLTVTTMGNHLAHAPPLPPTAEEGKPPARGSQLTPDSTGLENPRLETKTTGAVPSGGRKDEESTRRLQEDEKRKEHADKIRQEVKLYYLRTTFRTDPELSRRDQHKAARFLYGANIESTVSQNRTGY
jgi:ankyrin repeat protein